jgi:nucleotide-binding universal stress UspA family protein
MKAANTPSSSILLSIDPYQKGRKLMNRSIGIIKTLGKGLSTNVQPVYVAEKSRLSRLKRALSRDSDNFEERTKEKINKMLKASKKSGIEKAEILFDDERNRQKDARIVATFGKNHGDMMIVAATGAQPGIRSIFDESFTENLVSQANIPVVTVNPLTKIPPKIKKIVFTSDFSAESSRAFAKICELAKKLNAEVILYSVLKQYLYLDDISSFNVSTTVEGYNWIDFERKPIHSLAGVYLNRARRMGVKAKFYCEEDNISVPRAVMHYAHKVNADMIALAAKSNSRMAHTFGTVTQRLIRRADLPVWVYNRSKQRIR